MFPALQNEPEIEHTTDIHVSANLKQLMPTSRFDQISDYAKQMNIIKDIRKRLGIQDAFGPGSGLVTITWDELYKSEHDCSDQSFDAPLPKLESHNSFNNKA